MPEIDLKALKKQAEDEIEKAGELKDLDVVFNDYFGKNGEIARILKTLKNLPKEKRAAFGKEANELKNYLSTLAAQKIQALKEKAEKEIEERGWLDITAPGRKPAVGHLHPLTMIKRKVVEIFQAMGFSFVEGPEVETEWYNFDALNIPKDHPARDLWDTFYIKNGLLRTHTTPVDVRHLEKNTPPLRIITIGRCFRHEATDASHEFNFYQLDGLMVGKEISTANFKAVVEEFFKRFFNKEIAIRMRPSYFPFVEPGFEVDINCLICGGKGCSACSQTGWMEMMGAGMVHPNVLKNSGLNPGDWQGFAFGMGFDRLAMMKYKINDIRLFYGGDLRFLKQF